MDTWSFLRLQRDVLECGKSVATFYLPLVLGVGALVGAITGGLIVLARRRPHLARWIALGLLVACATGPVRPLLFDVAFVWGMVVSRVLRTWPLAREHVWATAAAFGAIGGALVACLATRLARRHPSGIDGPGAHSESQARTGPCECATRG
jgi:hypothetical protein